MSTVLSSSTKHVPILQFYDFGTPESSYRISLSHFQTLVTDLAAKGYTFITLSQYAAWMNGTAELPARQCIVLAFWGAFISQYTTAYPWLLANNVKFNLVIPVSFVENEDNLGTGAYFGRTALAAMLASGLCEVHSQGYHLKALFQGAPVATAKIFTANGHNLKWGGTEEFVEDVWSYAPLIGTNSSAQAVTSTYTFLCKPRQYLDAAPAPGSIVANYLALDQLVVIGSAYSPTITIKAKRHSDSTWTTIKASWQPNWAQAYATIPLDAPFTFTAGVQYDLQFITNSAQGSWGELVTMGSRTAGNPKLPMALWQANTAVNVGDQIYDSQGDIEEVVTAGVTGATAPSWSPLLDGLTNDYTAVWKNLGVPTTAGVATTCAANSWAPGFLSGEQIGGDIYLLESLAVESDPSGRVLEDAEYAATLLTGWSGSQQAALVFGYPFNTYSAAGIFLPTALASLHPVQTMGGEWLMDRWSMFDFALEFGLSVQLDPGNVTPILIVDPTKGLTLLENQIDAYSGLIWDEVPGWDGWTTFGWINEFAADYATEREKYASAWNYIVSPRIRFNSDGVTLNASDIAFVQDFLALPEMQGKKVLARITNEADSAIAHNTFANSSASVAALQTLLTVTLPDLAGLGLDIEGAAYTDRAIASAWIAALKAARDANFAARTLMGALPAKTSDSPTDPWSGWCNYATWLPALDYPAPMSYGYSEGSSSPGPSHPLSWMQSVFAYAAGIVAKSKLVVMLPFYGTHWEGGPSWGAAQLTIFYETLQIAHAFDAQWAWDATNQEHYWVNAGGSKKGYQPTPESMKVRLDAFAADGYSNFGVWAIGQGDSLFYQYAEGAAPVPLPYLKIPQGVEQSITQLEGQSSLGALELDVIDGEGVMTGLVGGGKFEGKKATLQVGYPGMALGDFVTVSTQQVDQVNALDDYTGFKITCRDLKRSAKQKVFLNGDDGWPVSSDHPRTLLLNPMDLALVILQNELGIGQATDDEAAWRIYDPSRWAGSGGSNPTLINPNLYVDVPAFLAYRNGIFAGYRFEFSLTEAPEAKQFLEYEICKALGGWMQTNALGQIQPLFFAPGEPPAPLFTFDDSNSIALPSMERMPITNQVTYRMDHDGSDFQTQMNFVDAASVQQFDLQGEQIIESKGMKRAWGGSALAAITAWRIFQRFGGVDPGTGQVWAGAPIYTVRSFLMTLAVEVGEYVYLTHPLLPNFQTGLRGVTNRLCQVVSRQPNYADGSMTYKLLDLGWLAGRSYLQIPANGTPAWTGASAEQKAKYAFLASSATGKFGDGSAAKRIW